MPLTSLGPSYSFLITGARPLKPEDQPSAEVRVATPDYLGTMGIPVVRGRGFGAADRAGSPNVLLITEAAAKKFFPGGNPIGKHVTFGWGDGHGHHLEGDVVGVVGDVRQSALAVATVPQFYAPYDQWPVSSFSVVLHTARDPQLVVNDARRVVHDMDGDLALAQVKMLDQVVAESVAQPRFYMVLLAALAFVAVALAAVGIYGVIAYLVSQRTREIGIRIALGARTAQVLRIVVVEGVMLAGLGLVAGLGGALALTGLMDKLLYATAPNDPLTYSAVAGFFACVALAASFIPAMRATHVDPLVAMRAE
jgi:putative ABC transport system permease protein